MINIQIVGILTKAEVKEVTDIAKCVFVGLRAQRLSQGVKQ